MRLFRVQVFAAGSAGALLIGALGGLYYRDVRDDLRRSISAQLETVANLEVRQVAAWRAERLGDAQMISHSPALARAVAEALGQPAPVGLARLRDEWLVPLATQGPYESVLLLDPSGRVLASAPADTLPPGGHLLGELAKVVAVGRPLISDLHRLGEGSPLHLDVLAPIAAAASDSPLKAPIAVIALRLSPYADLFPLLNQRPLRSDTGRMMLVRVEDNEVVVLSGEGDGGAVAEYRSPAAAASLPEAMAARGASGVREGVDRRGQPVLAAHKAVPDSNWHIVATMERSEAEAAIRAKAIQVASWVGALILGVAGAGAYLWRRRYSTVLRRTLLAEQHARQLAERLALVTRYANDIVIVADEAWRIVEVNERALTTYGYTMDEFRHKVLPDLRTPEERLKFDDRVRAVMRAGGAVFETVHQRKDGTAFPVEVSGNIVPNGEARLLLAILRDISDRKRAEALLRESEERYRSIFSGSKAVMILVDPDGGAVVDANAAACAYYGWSIEEFRGKRAADINVTPDHDVQGGLDAAKSGRRDYFVLQHRLANGSVRDVEILASPVVVHGRSLLLSIVHDITDRKILEQQLLHAQRMEAIGTLASGVAHDLNNVLTPVLMAGTLLQDRLPDPADRDLLRMAIVSVERGANVVRQLLSFGRAHVGRRVVVDVRQAITDVAKVMAETLPREIMVRSYCETDLGVITADPTQVNQVLMNLCLNARDAMPQGGTLTVRASNVQVANDDPERGPHSPAGPYVQIRVEDTGTGIPHHILHRIFDPFFTTKEVGKGTGLGLSTAAAIVQCHGGFIRVDSVVGQGTAFRVYFPIARDAATPPVLHPVEVPRVGAPSECVLVVDDERAGRETIRIVLEGQGYQVLVASTGVEALHVYAQHRDRIRVVLTDLMMPEMDGIVLIRKLRDLAAEVRIIAMTGLDEIARQHELATLGVTEILQKPFDARTLLRCLHAPHRR